MAKKPEVKLADPRADRARPDVLAGIAIGACGVGYMLALGFAQTWSTTPEIDAVGEVAEQTTQAELEVEHHAAANAVDRELARSEAEPVATPAQPVTAPPDEARSVPDPSPEPSKDDPQRIARATSAATPAPVAEATRETPKRRFEMGIVAYLHCEGLERPRGRYPCPRDLPFEAQIWAVLAQLPECSIADPGQGRAEARLTLRGDAAPSVEWKVAGQGASLDPQALAACMGPKLSEVRSRLRSPHTVVSFRFALREP